MSRLTFLLGGALVGAAGLAMAALLNKKGGDSLSPGKAKALDADGLTDQLHSFFIKANALAMKCSQVTAEASELQCTPIDLPDDDLFTRAGSKIGGTMTAISRKWKHNALLDIKKEAEQLYAEYRAVFAKANGLLAQHGAQEISYKEISFNDKDLSLNNALSNDDWILELDECADKIRDALNTSAAVAEQLINGLERIQDAHATTDGATPAALLA